MRVALFFALLSVVILGIAAIMPILFVRDLLIWCSGANAVLALRAGEIARFGKGG